MVTNAYLFVDERVPYVVMTLLLIIFLVIRFVECKDRINRTNVMLPYSFLPSMAAPKLRNAAEKVNELAIIQSSLEGT